jgi:hypothetical protein
MAFSIETRYPQKPLIRHGFFKRHEDAKVSILAREEQALAAAVYAGPATVTGALGR